MTSLKSMWRIHPGQLGNEGQFISVLAISCKFNTQPRLDVVIVVANSYLYFIKHKYHAFLLLKCVIGIPRHRHRSVVVTVALTRSREETESACTLHVALHFHGSLLDLEPVSHAAAAVVFGRQPYAEHNKTLHIISYVYQEPHISCARKIRPAIRTLDGYCEGG